MAFSLRLTARVAPAPPARRQMPRAAGALRAHAPNKAAAAIKPVATRAAGPAEGAGEVSHAASPSAHKASPAHKRGAPNETVPPHVDAMASAAAPDEEGATAADSVIRLVYESEWVKPVLHVYDGDEECAPAARARGALRQHPARAFAPRRSKREKVQNSAARKGKRRLRRKARLSPLLGQQRLRQPRLQRPRLSRATLTRTRPHPPAPQARAHRDARADARGRGGGR
jgi:hypothetical protein